MRVNAQLIDARTDAHLWANTYDGELADIFGIQSEIAQRIADQLRAKISPTERSAIELLPISKDALFGPGMVQNLALVYAWTGERNLAIEKLEMLSKIPGNVSYGDLRFNPCWDSLRGDPRFEKMVASLKPNLTASTK